MTIADIVYHPGRSQPGPAWRKIVLAVCTLLVTLSACARPSPPPPVMLRMSVFRILDDLPYFVMQEQGLARQYGLHSVEVAAQSGPAVIAALAAGTLDVAANVGSAPVLVAAEQGLIPDILVSVGANTLADPAHPAFAVLAAPSIHTWADLAGQYVAMNAPDSHSAIALRQRLHQEGVYDTTAVLTPLANMGLSVPGGNVAAAVMPEPWLTQALLCGDGHMLGWVIGGPSFERVEQSLILVRTALYREQPQVVQAFPRAHVHAVRWINQHPAQAQALLAKWLDVSPDVARQMHVLRWAVDARHEPALLEGVQPVLVAMGVLKGRIPARQLYDETLLNEVLAAKR